MTKTINESEYNQLSALFALAKSASKMLEDITAAAEELLQDQRTDNSYTFDAIYNSDNNDGDVDELLEKLKITVQYND